MPVPTDANEKHGNTADENLGGSFHETVIVNGDVKMANG
jgi:hypothetical protein